MPALIRTGVLIDYLPSVAQELPSQKFLPAVAKRAGEMK